MNAQRLSKAITYLVTLIFLLVSCTSGTNATPENTATPTITPSPTPIPGPWYGIPITIEKANRVRQLAIWGKGLPWTLRQTYWPAEYMAGDKRYPELTKLGLGNLWTLWATDYAVQGKVFVVQTTRGIYLYSTETGEEIAGRDNVISYAISDDGNLIATGDNNARVKLWNAVDGTLISEFQYELAVPKDPLSAGGNLLPAVGALAISHNGKMVAAGFNEEKFAVISVWNIGQPNSTITHFGSDAGYDGIRVLAFSPNDEYIYDGSFLRQISDGQMVLRFEQNGFDYGGWDRGTVRPAFSPDGRLVAVSTYPTIYILDATTGKVVTKSGSNPSLYYYKFSVSSDWKTLIVDYLLDNKREIRSLPDGKLIETTTRPTEFPISLFDSGHLWGLGGARALPDNSLLVWGATNEFIYWWKPSGKQLIKYPQEDQKVYFSPTGKYAAICQNGEIVIYTIEGIYKNIPLEGHYTCDGIIFSPNDDTFAVWTNNRLALVSLSTNKAYNIIGHQKQIITATFSRDGMQLATVTASKPREISIWDTKTLVQRLKITNNLDTPSYDGEGYVITFSPKSNILATREDGNPLRLWNLADGSPNGSIDVGATKIAFAPDEKIIATANSAGIISLWMTQSGEKLTELRGHVHLFEWINRLPFYSFPPDGLDFLSIESLVLYYNGQAISSLEFLTDGAGLLSVGWDGTARLWGIDPNITSPVAPPPITYPIFEDPSIRETIDYNSTWKFKVYPVANAEAYYWEFLQNNGKEVVWSIQVPYNKLEIPKDSDRDQRFERGELVVDVKALVNGEWTKVNGILVILK